MYIKEAANCGLRFRGFKPTNEHSTLDALKGEKEQVRHKESTRKIKSKKQSTNQVF